MNIAIGNIMKSGRGRPKTDAEPVMVRMPPDLIEAIDVFRRDHPAIPTRPEAIRLLLRDSLISLRLLDTPKD